MFFRALLKFKPWNAPLARRATLRVVRLLAGFRLGARRFVVLLFLRFAIDVAPFVAATLRATGFLLDVDLRLFRAGLVRVDAFLVFLRVDFFFVLLFLAAFNNNISLIP